MKKEEKTEKKVDPKKKGKKLPPWLKDKGEMPSGKPKKK